MDLRIIVIHPLTIQRGHLPNILTDLTKAKIHILASDTYPVCLTTMRALTRSQSDEPHHEDYIQSFAQRPSSVLLLSSSSDIETTLGTRDHPARHTIRARYQGSNWIASPPPHDVVFTSFPPEYNETVFSMFFSPHRGWGPLSQYIS